VDKSATADDLAVATRDLGIRLADDQEKALFDIICLDCGKAFYCTDFVVLYAIRSIKM
jgi:hypothetical protein